MRIDPLSQKTARLMIAVHACVAVVLWTQVKEPHQDQKVSSAEMSEFPVLEHYTPKIQILKSHIIEVLRAVDSFQTNPHQMASILIWGVGYDSKLWCAAGGGKTIFLEDSQYWADFTAKQMPCQIVMVDYQTKLTQAKELLQNPTQLKLDLPEEIYSQTFDVIVVDAPMGFAPDKPGRMKSIYTSKLLAHEKSHVFVDDYQRAVENLYARTFLEPIFGNPKVYQGRGGFAHYFRIGGRARSHF